MFKIKCTGCGDKISKNYKFCPKCGTYIEGSTEKKIKDSKDYGMIGTIDEDARMIRNENINNIKLPLGLNNIFNKLMKEMEKNFRELDKNMSHEIKEKTPAKAKSGISISITTGQDGEPRVKIKKYGDEAKKEVREMEIEEAELSPERAKELSKLPRAEAKTNVRRLSEKIVYEIEIPGVKRMEDIIIRRLENGIEIKAYSEKKAYYKTIPADYLITNYSLKKGMLTLELLDE